MNRLQAQSRTNEQLFIAFTDISQRQDDSGTYDVAYFRARNGAIHDVTGDVLNYMLSHDERRLQTPNLPEDQRAALEHDLQTLHGAAAVFNDRRALRFAAHQQPVRPQAEVTVEVAEAVTTEQAYTSFLTRMGVKAPAHKPGVI